MKILLIGGSCNIQFNSEIQKRRSSGSSFDRGKIPEKERRKGI